MSRKKTARRVSPETTVKTTESAESPNPPIEKIPQPHGGALNAGGTPGNKGGRKPEWLKEWCDELLANPATKQQVEEILADKKHPAFAAMWKAVGDRAHGKPRQTMEHHLGSSLEELVAGSMKKP